MSPPISAALAARVPTDDVARRCYHCGQTNPGPSRWVGIVAGVERRFCCAGCQAVAETMHAAGLDSLYAGRTETAARPARDTEDWLELGSAAEASGLVRQLPGDLCEASLLLDGLTCGACAPLIESWLGRQPGIREASVNVANRRLRVIWDRGPASLASVLRAVASAGYAAYPYDPARREALARRERRVLLTRMAVALLAMMQVMMFALPTYLSADDVAPEARLLLNWASFVLTLPVMFYAALPMFRNAWRDIAHLRVGMDVPIALGLAAAFGASAWSVLQRGGPVYFDSVTMFVALLLVARYGETVARQRAGAAIETIARQRPDTAERLTGWPASGEPETVAAHRLAPGEIVLIRPGARVPADGVIVEGRSHIEEAMLTGESVPLTRAPGDALWAGAVNRDGALLMRVEAAGESTRLAAILRLGEAAAAARPVVARQADRVAAHFVAALLVLAAVTAIAWCLTDPGRALPVTFAVLAVSCPCALALATPAALSAAAGSLARRGVVMARADALETLAKVTHVVFDKTGTLTEGQARIVACVKAAGDRGDGALGLAAAVGARSEHPLARALVVGYSGPRTDVEGVEQKAGQGIAAVCDGTSVRLGNAPFVAALAGPMPPEFAAFSRSQPGTLVGLGDAHGWRALFAFADALRSGARQSIAELDRLGVATLLLSGDRREAVDAVATALGIADARAGLDPARKQAAIAALQARGAVVAMVGDGINDAPALAQAQVSISLGSAAPLAQWTADVVILSDRLDAVAYAVTAARRTFAVIRQNLIWAVAYNAVAVPAAAFGLVSPLLAAVGMAGSSLLVVGNALRLSRPSRTARTQATEAALADGACREPAWKS